MKNKQTEKTTSLGGGLQLSNQNSVVFGILILAIGHSLSASELLGRNPGARPPPSGLAKPKKMIDSSYNFRFYYFHPDSSLVRQLRLSVTNHASLFLPCSGVCHKT